MLPTGYAKSAIRARGTKMSISQRLNVRLLGVMILGLVLSGCLTQSATLAPPPPPLASPIDSAQKAVLYEEGGPVGHRYVGSTAWHRERLPPARGQSEGVTITVDAEIPDQRIGVQLSLRRNSDKALRASHIVEMKFKLPADFPHGGISSVPGLLMKDGETLRGVPLVGASVKLGTNHFVVRLSSVDAEMQRNIQLLKERTRLEIPIVYSDGKRAIMAIEKGPEGERVFSDAFAVLEE
jgi:hypothetical protein